MFFSRFQVVGDIGPLRPVKKDSKYEYSFQYWASAGDVLKIVPKAPQLLFSPSEATITMKNDCVDVSDDGSAGPLFSASRGLFFTGSVVPPLEGVKVGLITQKIVL